MKKRYFLFILVSNCLLAQNVGIDTSTPKAAFEVKSKANEKTFIDGVIFPKLTLEELTSKGDNLYGIDQTGTVLYITDATAGNLLGPRKNITQSGYYFFDGQFWLRMTNSQDSFNIYNLDNLLNSDRTVNLDGKTISFQNNTGIQAVNQFSINSGQFSVDALNNRIGIGTTTPTYNMEVKGTVALSDVKDNNIVSGLTGVGINMNTGQLGTYTPNAYPLLYLISTKNDYGTYSANGAVHYIELTQNATIPINTLGGQVINAGPNSNASEDYIILSQTGYYKIESNYSLAINSSTGSCNFEVFGTPDANPGTYDLLFASNNFSRPTNNTQAVTAYVFITITEPTRIRLGVRHEYGGVLLRRPLTGNAPTATVQLAIVKL